MDKIKPIVLIPILMGLFAGQVILAMRTKAPTCDEFAHHIASGYSHLVTGDFRMNPAEPPFSRLLSALPLYFIRAKAPLDHWSWKNGDSPEFARQFFYYANHDQDRLVFWARMPILVLSLFFAYFVFAWAKDLFGFAGGLGALILYVYCPDILAHSGLATSDISVAFFFYLTLWRFWKYLRKPSRKNMILTGLMSGLSLLSKFSAILIFPTLFLIVAVSRSWKRIPLRAYAGFLIVCVVTVWAGYFFEVKPLLTNTPDPSKKIAALQNIGGERLVRFGRETPIPLATFVSAFSSMVFTRMQGTNAFLMGEWSHGIKGWWYYYFVAFGIKNTIPMLLLILMSFLWLPKIQTDRLTKIFLVTPVILFFIVTLHDKAQAGIRYFLPVYPLFFLLGGGLISLFWKADKILKSLIVALLSWHALEAAVIYPDYLSYFNEIVGGSSQGYRYLRDSNIDWGQDMKGLAEWSKKQDYKEIVLYSISPVDLDKAYGVRWRPMTQTELVKPKPAIYALGVHHIDSVAWFKQFKPTCIIGHSLYIYDLKHSDVS